MDRSRGLVAFGLLGLWLGRFGPFLLPLPFVVWWLQARQEFMGDGDDVTGPVAVVLLGVGFLALLVGIIVKVIVITLRARGEAGPRAGQPGSRSAQAAELEDRVQLDRVWGDPGLAVLEIEEGNPDHRRSHGWRTRPRGNKGRESNGKLASPSFASASSVARWPESKRAERAASSRSSARSFRPLALLEQL